MCGGGSGGSSNSNGGGIWNRLKQLKWNILFLDGFPFCYELEVDCDGRVGEVNREREGSDDSAMCWSRFSSVHKYAGVSSFCRKTA